MGYPLALHSSRIAWCRTSSSHLSMSRSTITACWPDSWAVSFLSARSNAASVDERPPMCPQNSSDALAISHCAETGRRARPQTLTR
eukprot:7909563-Pyramimonas_sp.AAC.1